MPSPLDSAAYTGTPRLAVTGARGVRSPGGRRSPYETSAWLGSRWPNPLPTVPANAPENPAFAPLQPGAARPAYDLAGIAPWLGPYWRIPLPVDYSLLLKIRESIPLLDAAILRMKELVGWPEVQAAPRLKRDIDNWLEMLPSCRCQFGARSWGKAHLDNAYTFGRAHAEVLLTATRSDVHSLVEVHPATTGLRPRPDGYGLDVVQYQHGGGVPVTLAPELLITSTHDFRGDDPNGTSLLASLPFVSEIYSKMLRALGQTWDRFGVPTYVTTWEPPADWNDPSGEQTARIMANPQAQMQQALLNRANGKVSDLFLAGKWTISIMGAQGETLEFSETARSIAEQITAKFGIPPFMFGFSWASTERMSTAQAKALTEIIEASRDMLTPGIRQLIELRQRLTGRTGKFSLDWPKVSLVDLIDQARADWMESQARQVSLSNWQEQVKLGIRSLEEMAVEFREDLDDVPLGEVRARLNGQDGLPKLEEELPDPVPVQVAGMRSQDGPPGGNSPRDESMKDFALNGNGNGRH